MTFIGVIKKILYALIFIVVVLVFAMGFYEIFGKNTHLPYLFFASFLFFILLSESFNIALKYPTVYQLINGTIFGFIAGQIRNDTISTYMVTIIICIVIAITMRAILEMMLSASSYSF
jgi:hypothetical protein